MRITNQVYGVSNDLIDTYIERPEVDQSFTKGLQKNKHIIVYGASKQGKTSLTNKHLTENDYVKVNCSPSATTLDIYNSIARQLDIDIIESKEVTTIIGGDVFCKTFLHNIAKKKYTPLRLKFFSDYFGLDRAFLSRKLSPVKLKMCA